MTFTAGTVVMAGLFAVLRVLSAYEGALAGPGPARVDAVDGQVNGGRLAAVKFLTGYVVELSLSMDNVFVIALIFEHLRVPAACFQHRVLFWGILGALVDARDDDRGGGAARGALPLDPPTSSAPSSSSPANAHALLRARQEEEEEVEGLGDALAAANAFPGDRPLPRAALRRGDRTGRAFLTPLAVALVLVETTDLIFAVDSIPAIFAITADPFLVFTSNVFAILCLRSLYFGLAGLIQKFKYLKVSLALVLAIVGVKMLTAEWIKHWLGDASNFWLLGVIFTVLIGGGVASWIADRRPGAA
jgi:tellurite resistance protein TerC